MRVVIADDSALIREGLARLLMEAGIDVVAKAGDVPELVAAVLQHHPDVAVIDIRRPPTFTHEGAQAGELRQTCVTVSSKRAYLCSVSYLCHRPGWRKAYDLVDVVAAIHAPQSAQFRG